MEPRQPISSVNRYSSSCFTSVITVFTQLPGRADTSPVTVRSRNMLCFPKLKGCLRSSGVMATGAGLYRLLTVVTGRFGGEAPRAAVRVLSCAAGGRPQRGAEGSGVLPGRADRFGGVTVNLGEAALPQDISEGAFGQLLRDSLVRWKAERKVAVWLRVPISLSRCAAAAASLGFTFHHAKRDHAVLALWLGDGQSRLPGFATHQVGVAGAVVDESSGKVLVVQDKNKTKNAWKFPGGLSDPGENIGATAVREVFEETGVRSEFRSLLSIRQQHDHPNAFGMSDMYIICRLSPLTYSINFCRQECLRCEWLDLAELARTDNTTPITSRVARLLLHGVKRGFGEIDLAMEELPAVYSGMFYQLYHRQLPPKPKP